MNHSFAVDCHNHSNCSPDGQLSPQAMLDRAKELGLYAYTLTDHCECNQYEEKYRQRVGTAWQAMNALAVPQGLQFYRGIELGQPMQNLPGATEAIGRYPYDFVIGSLHNLQGQEDFYYMDCRRMDSEELFRILDQYWDELLDMISWGGFDSLGHLTYPLRYIQGEQGVRVDMAPHQKKIDEVLAALIQKNKALEVNTSGLRQKIGVPLPDFPLLRRYHELGGRLVTLGSDAHCTEDLGNGIDQSMELLKAAGFTQFTLYIKHEPHMLPLE